MFDNKPNSMASGAVAGTGITPANASERKTLHYIENIFDPDKHPPEDLSKYVVPHEQELVFDVPNGVIYMVAKVDWQATLKSTLVPWRLTSVDGGNTNEQDLIFGLRGGPMMGEALLAVDYSVRPNVARVDATIMRPGAAYAYVFMDNDASENGRIISAQYDKSQNMTTNKVPCKLAEIVDRTNEMIMTTGSFSVTENEEALPDGKRCVLVFYDQAHNFIPPVQMLMVQHCSYMKDHQIGIRYITSIELISPWFTNTNSPDRLFIPINVNLLSVELRAAVHYSDGSTELYPVNGTKFTLYGLTEHRPTWVGQTSEITLIYKLDKDEQFLIANPGNPNYERQIYTIQASAANGAYSPKIYTYPQWDSTTSRYTLKHYMFDLDRKTRIDVTDKVKMGSSSPAFRPTLYGTTQDLTFVLNVRDVTPTYQSVNFIQHTEITLYKDINGPGKRWEVSYVHDMPFFGGKVVQVKNKGLSTTFNLQAGNGYASFEEWLAGLYYAVGPSYDPRNENKAPAPTHFDLMDETGRKWRFAITDWNKDNLLGIEMQKGKTWFVSWVVRAANGSEQQLALTGLTVEVV